MRGLFVLLASLLFFQVASAERLAKKHHTTFVTTSNDGHFMFNGTKLSLIGTTAYWIPTLSSSDDIDFTFGNISQAGFNSVRLWAFNDVPTIPENGTWFQHIDANGTFTINNGTNGLQKLDTVVQLAEKHKLFLILSLTNNWSPLPNDSIVNSPINFTTRDTTDNTTLPPRNFLSNQYGGMDVYVRQLTESQEHDQFYLNASLVNAFKNYTTQVVSRYVNSPYVLAWEVANDPRCNSSLSASNICNTTTVTIWHADVAQHIQKVDPNHLVSSGSQGFFCADCKKIFQKTAPPPQPSSAVTRRRFVKPLTKKALLQEKREILKKRRAADIAERTPNDGGIRVRGRWVATPTRRQEDTGVGSAFNGVSGVDSEDILSIPHIGFGSFQLFPDQFTYGLVEPKGPLTFNESLAVGLEWIGRQVQAAARVGKPIVNTGIGLVTRNNSQAFVPFDSLTAPFGSGSTSAQQKPFGVTDTDRDQAYLQWIHASLSGGLAGVVHYQWGQGGLKAQSGTPITPNSNSTPITPTQDQTGLSPNDGYSVQGTGEPAFAQVIQQESQAFGISSS